MRRLNITAKIWLSIAVFVAGFLVFTILSQVEGLRAEDSLDATSNGLFPAAQRSQQAEAAFERAVKSFSDAVLVQDASGLDRAADEGRSVVASLKAILAIRRLSPERASEVQRLSSSAEQFFADAKSTYGTILSNPSNMTAMQDRMRDLASRTDTLKSSLVAAQEHLADDLRKQIAAMEVSSERQRWLGLILCTTTLLISGLVVNLTIRRAITGPITRVIHGVQQATDQAMQTSDVLAQSGQTVANDAQDQAACIQETSASLEEVSATVRVNADRAAEADRLMQQAGQTVNRATQAMNELRDSIDAIRKSNDEVSGVLKSINQIAFNTNILALNAAVEAARAGEAGAGFSVVAAEVRSLAQRAASAARLSEEIIQRTISDVSKGVDLVGLACRAFGEVSENITNSSRTVAKIASGSREQATGVNHITQAIARIGQVTQNNVKNANRTAQAASAMSQQVESTRDHLNQLVAVVGLQQNS